MRIAAAIFAGLLLASLTVQSQEPQTVDTISIDTNLISVPVIVSDRDNRYVPDLKIGSFHLFDNQIEQKITYFDTGEEPLNVVLMLDTSLSTSGVLNDIKKAAKEFLKELRPQDRAMIVTFDWQTQKLSTLTNDRKELETAINHTKVGKNPGTVLNDALMEVSTHVLQPIRGRKAIILLSDGEDRDSGTTSEDLIASESEADAMIYSIYYQSELQRYLDNGPRRDPGGRFPGRGRGPGRGGPFHHATPQRPGGPQGRGRPPWRRDDDGIELMEKLAQVTGGRFYQGETKKLKDTFALIAEELRHQYRLGFYPDDLKRDGAAHALLVKVNLPDVSVRSRHEYLAK
ncbi:MAG TPA: VWA domain-containing protein [Pyrinomonadaceae bacterium]|nr:VWA domain-containing protein [Pyrinomonadaceae bacterium]